jgi:protein-tyrosine phosphatase
MDEPFVDIHCHLLPGVDDGAKSWQESLEMTRMAVQDGIQFVIATPHQLGAFGHRRGCEIRDATQRLQNYVAEQGSGLRILPGADVRVEPDMVPRIARGEVLTLADQRKHVLLELPHEIYVPLDRCLRELADHGLVGVLSHPERNQGLLRQPRLIPKLLQLGCLMQITAGSLLGSFGPHSQALCESMLDQGYVHFVATDAHGTKSRRPLLRRAFLRVSQIAGAEMAREICCHNPARVVRGESIPQRNGTQHSSGIMKWLPWHRAA